MSLKNENNSTNMISELMQALLVSPIETTSRLFCWKPPITGSYIINDMFSNKTNTYWFTSRSWQKERWQSFKTAIHKQQNITPPAKTPNWKAELLLT